MVALRYFNSQSIVKSPGYHLGQQNAGLCLLLLQYICCLKPHKVAKVFCCRDMISGFVTVVDLARDSIADVLYSLVGSPGYVLQGWVCRALSFDDEKPACRWKGWGEGC